MQHGGRDRLHPCCEHAEACPLGFGFGCLKRSEQTAVCKWVQTEGQADFRLAVRGKWQPMSRMGGWL